MIDRLIIVFLSLSLVATLLKLTSLKRDYHSALTEICIAWNYATKMEESGLRPNGNFYKYREAERKRRHEYNPKDKVVVKSKEVGR